MAGSILPLALAFFVVLFGSVFLHELGHAVASRACGFRVTSFGIGIGRPLLVWNWGETRVFICRTRPSAGLTFIVMPQIFAGRARRACALAGGLLANAALLIAALTARRLLSWGEPVWDMAALMNGMFLVSAGLPLSLRLGDFSVRTDGAQILAVLRRGHSDAPAPERAEMLSALRGLWQSVGDTAGLYFHRLIEATVWDELGCARRAERLWEEARALPMEPTPFSRAYAALVGAAVLSGVGRLEDAERSLAAAEQWFGSEKYEAGLLLCALARAELRHQGGDGRAAAGRLDALAQHPLCAEHPALRANLVGARLRARADLGDAEEVETLLAEYGRARDRCPSAAGDVDVYHAVARMWRAREEVGRADLAYRKAIAALREVYVGLKAAEDRAELLSCREDLLAGARHCRALQGGEEASAALDALFPAPDVLDRQVAAHEAERGRRLHRRGLLLALVNVLLAAAALAAGVADAAGLRREWILLALLLLFYALLAILSGVWMFAAARLWPSRRRASGATALWLGAIPWISWLVLLAVPLEPR